MSEGTGCIDTEAVRTQTQAFTVTGGTGVYAGASGSGTLERVLGNPLADGRHGRETWKGTLTAPGLEFDAPRRANGVRVRFTVTAADDVDGQVPVNLFAQLRKSVPDRSYARQVLRYRYERQLLNSEFQRHRSIASVGTALVRSPKSVTTSAPETDPPSGGDPPTRTAWSQ